MRELPADATVADVFLILKNPERYLVGLADRLAAEEKLHPGTPIGVRIGITGSGQMPYYRVVREPGTPGEAVIGTYYDNHTPFEVDTAADNRAWSSAFSTRADVDRLRNRLSD